MKLVKLAVSCGGTGGHFFPGLSIARTFQAQGGKVLLLLSGVHAESQRETAAQFGIKAIALPPMPHYSKHPFRFISGFVGGYRETKKELKRFAPQALLGMGSFAALPIMLAARHCRIPLFIHDGNSRIGKANRFFSRWSKFAGTAFPPVNAVACRCPVEAVGMPLRPELLDFANMDKVAAVEALNREFGTDFSPDKPIFLVTGGSQGAAVFNEVLPAAFKKNGSGFQVIHLTGKGKLADTVKAYKNVPFPVKLVETTGKMAEVMAAADLVFSRSGGSTAAELALFGKASVLVPYPYAAEDHQMDNARYFESAGAAYLVKNSSLSVECAEKIIADYLAEPDKFRQMGECMRKLAKPAASEKMIEEISLRID
ncbi:MAG: UDP-N-acetylglucosamine--N-acetylmuramyl-(pentapeptide) pyrophosphoryl-undecaprenol N-acetylglucosamine transferase [Lentisphaerae bacterium]|nr:UDP-N-acetylglucosamine--N-acetylmuramyl-(pentapeptide) pyrophosphoryl-undecaprenol N-acetylglucosamine transferase [Lentisphaerota bacterium]